MRSMFWTYVLLFLHNQLVHCRKYHAIILDRSCSGAWFQLWNSFETEWINTKKNSRFSVIGLVDGIENEKCAFSLWAVCKFYTPRFLPFNRWPLRYAYDYYRCYSVICPRYVGLLKNLNSFNSIKVYFDFFRDVVERILRERSEDKEVKQNTERKFVNEGVVASARMRPIFCIRYHFGNSYSVLDINVHLIAILP